MSILKYPNSQINSQVINNLSSAALTGQDNNFGAFSVSAQVFVSNKAGVGQVVIDPSGSSFSGSLSALTLSSGNTSFHNLKVNNNVTFNPANSGTGTVNAALPLSVTSSLCTSSSKILITPTSDWGVYASEPSRFYVDSITANSFTVNLIADSGSMTFHWFLFN